MRAIRFAPPTLAARHLQNRDRARLRARLGSAMRHRSRRRHADMPTCRHAALPPLPPPGETARPHSASDAAAYALGHRRSIGTPSALRRRARRQRTLNAERARSRRPARRAANARAIAPPPASREPSSRLAAQCLQSLDHAEQRAAVLFGAVPRLDDRLAQQIVVRRRQPGRLPRLDAIETA
ncbi:hypothetical protein BMAA1599 [Burkholderia mallei ATCC 23344]|uniref:Uncharacterized protein n=1 Tax=Burkholderia mallei (strain ATCC 23344) TaxID=243160 RepID=A0A0H2XF26_BURMA|nr:hypothetical protein BMAA1599 [Burkholderia mallei ATCC 23344]